MLPFSEACERNKLPILEVLRTAFADRSRVIEIGAGTGQHAVYFGWQLANLTWQPTERREALEALAARVGAEGPPNVAPPVALDVLAQPWPRLEADAAFTANTVHIMPWHATVAMFAGLGRLLATDAVMAVYGPFKYGGRFTTPSNEQFDRTLRASDPASGLRDVEAVDTLARRAGFQLEADHAMPANNRLIVWRRA